MEFSPEDDDDKSHRAIDAFTRLESRETFFQFQRRENFHCTMVTLFVFLKISRIRIVLLISYICYF